MNAKKIILSIIVGIVIILTVFATVKKNNTVVQTSAPVLQAPISSNVEPAQIMNQSKQKGCPPGFVLIPGNSHYATEDFCLMKYEAKCALASDPTNGMEPALGDTCSGESGSHRFFTYKNSGSGCACANDKHVVSTPSGFPVAYIPQSNNTPNNAKNYCSTLGWHLITNNEWMTVARDVEGVSANWCDLNGTNCDFPPGTKGKILANGHNDNNGINGNDSALIAGNDDQPCLGTTTDHSNMCGGPGSQKRTLTLSNGEVLWDFAGNVWEWIDATVARKDEPQSATSGTRDRGWLKSDFAPGSLQSVITDNGQGPSMGYDAFRPSNPTWNATNGVGRIYHFGSINPDTNTTAYAFIRSGNWKHGADDGAFTIHLSPEPTHSANDVGFRCVTVPTQFIN